MSGKGLKRDVRELDKKMKSFWTSRGVQERRSEMTKMTKWMVPFLFVMCFCV